MYTREHVTINYDTAKWGSPCATVKVNKPDESEYHGSEWHLISPEGMPNQPTRSDGQPWTYHVHRVDGHRGNAIHGQWYGCTSHAGLEDSIDELLADLTEWGARFALEEQADSSLHQLKRRLAELTDDENRPYPADLRAGWPKVEEAFAAVASILFDGPPVAPAPARPVPPMHPWAAIAGYFDRRTSDNRIWDDRAELALRHDRSVPLLGDGRDIGGVTGHVDCLIRSGDVQWAFGLASTPELAASLNDGTVWLGFDLSPDTDVDHSGGLAIFYGTILVYGAHVRPAASSPWLEGE